MNVRPLPTTSRPTGTPVAGQPRSINRSPPRWATPKTIPRTTSDKHSSGISATLPSVTTLNGGASENSDTPIPSDLTSAEEFGAALTRLRDQLGLSIRQVARLSDIPSATLGGYFTGRHLPPPTQPQIVGALLEALQVPPSEQAGWREASIRLRRVPGPRAIQPPYRGLESYRADDAELYVGREDQVDQLVAMVANPGTGPRCIAVVGPSGCGKSSLIQAGLVARLRAQATGVLSLVARESDAELAALVTDAIGEFRVIVLDQFEQVLADDIDEDRKQRLLTLTAQLAARADTVVVLGLRADFYGKALLEPTLLPLLTQQMPVGPMSREQLTRVIREPAAKVKQPVEQSFIELVLRDLAPQGALTEATRLPLVSHALLMTWEHNRRKGLTTASYAAIGGVAGAVQMTAETAYQSLGEEAREATRHLFDLMLLVDADGTAIRRPTQYGDIKNESAMVDAAEAFVAARILTATSTGYAISHESLASAWPRLAGWLETDLEHARVRRRLAIAAGSWEEQGRKDDELIRGSLLSDAEALAAAGTALTSIESALIQASRQAASDARERDRRSRNRLRVVAICALTLAIVATVLSVYLIQSRADITNERNQALSRQIAERATLLRSSNPALAAQLALAAYQIAPTDEARSVALEATGDRLVTRLLGSPGPMRVAPSPQGHYIAIGDADGAVRIYSTAGAAPREIAATTTHAGQLYAVAWSADSGLLAVGGSGAEVLIYDMSTPEHPVLAQTLKAGGSAGIENLHFAGSVLYAATTAPSLLRWRIAGRSSTELPATTSFGGSVNDVAISPQGIIATASSDGLVRLWRPQGDSLALVQKISIGTSSNFAFSVAFSPDGHYLANTEKDKIVRIFDVSSGTAQPVTTLGGFPNWVNSVAFSPDGRHISAGASGSLLQTWSVGSWTHESSFVTPSAVTTVAYSTDGATIMLGTLDGTALLLPAANHRPAAYPDSIWTLGSSPDGRHVYVGVGTGLDGIADLDISTGAPIADATFTGPATAGAPDASSSASPDGRWIASGTSTGNVMFWQVSGPRSQPIVMPAASQLIEYTRFSPDGHLLAATADDGTITVFNVGGPSPKQVGQFHIKAQGFGVAFSPDGSLLAVGGTDNAVHLFQVSSGREVATLGGFANYVYGVAFSPDSRYLAGGSTDKTIRIWDIVKPSQPRLLPNIGTGPTDSVYWLTWDRSGTRLMGASQDGTVWIWRTSGSGASPWASIGNLGAGATTAIFLPDGKIVAAGDGGAVDFWDGDMASAAQDICAHAGSPITRAEWKQYVPGAPYRNPCG